MKAATGLAPACPNCGVQVVGAWCAGCGQELAMGHGSLRRSIRRQWERIRHLARLTHLRDPSPWSVHFVFALHLTAWSVVANVVFYVAQRLFGLSPTANDAYAQWANLALVVAIELWLLAYVLLAFRRVYADRWIAGSVKAE